MPAPATMTPRVPAPPPPPPVPGAECTESIGTLSATVTRSGTWTDGCQSQVGDRGYARYYSFTLPEETGVAIDLASSVDTYLHLRSGSVTLGKALRINDDIESGNTNSWIVATLTAGTYTIEATTYTEEVTGNFSLSVTT